MPMPACVDMLLHISVRSFFTITQGTYIATLRDNVLRDAPSPTPSINNSVHMVVEGIGHTQSPLLRGHARKEEERERHDFVTSQCGEEEHQSTVILQVHLERQNEDFFG